jgi:uncharacterized phage protein (TIGR02218 family)
MTYETFEESDDDGFAVELYLFEGSFEDFALTSYPTSYPYLLRTYVPTPGLKRRNIKIDAAGGSSSGALEVEIPYDHPLASAYAFTNTPPDLTLTLYRGHASDPDGEFRVLWTGPVTSWAVQGRVAKLRIPSSFDEALERPIPGIRWQGPCNHLLYDSRCGVSRLLHQHTAVIVAVSGVNVTLASLPWTGTDGDGGEMVNSVTGERRTIVSHAGAVVTLKLPFSRAEDGDLVTVYKGCDHTFATCQSKFSNGNNFLGFPLVPGINPFSTGRIR